MARFFAMFCTLQTQIHHACLERIRCPEHPSSQADKVLLVETKIVESLMEVFDEIEFVDEPSLVSSPSIFMAKCEGQKEVGSRTFIERDSRQVKCSMKSKNVPPEVH